MISIRYTADQYPCYLCLEITQSIAVIIYTLVAIASAYSPPEKIVKEEGDKLPLQVLLHWMFWIRLIPLMIVFIMLVFVCVVVGRDRY
jgi:hypothetical protein